MILAITGARTFFVLHGNAATRVPPAAALLPNLPSIPPVAMDVATRSRARQALDSSLATSISTAQHYSFAVMDASGATIYARNADTAVTPASTQKLLIAAAALDLLGGDYRYQTLIAATSAPDSGGAVDGNVYLVGSGDPSLRSTDLADGARSIAGSGVRAITGRVLADPSALDGPEINPHWDASDANEDFQTAVSAISIDGNTAEFDVSGAGEDGQAASVSVKPPGAPVSVSGSVMTGSANDVVIAAMEPPNTFALSGSIPPGERQRYWLPVHGMAQYAAAVFGRCLNAAGIAAKANGVAAAPPDTIALWTHRSQPLRAIVHHMLYWSDNHYAEQLLRTLARERGDTPDDAGGIAVERSFLRSRNLPVSSVRVVDGSGLSDANRLPAIVLARLLSDAELRGGLERLYDILPAGGKEGTLKYYDFSSAAGRVRAKTGHLSGVEGLAGYVDTRHHGRLSFAFLVNFAGGDPDREMVDALDRLSEL